MKTIKLIDLLNMKAKEENLPKKIEVFDYIYELDEDNDYYNENKETLEDEAYIWKYLNEKVEIIEESDDYILTDKEKEYLSAVIRPFRDRVTYILKDRCYEKEYIYVQIDEYNGFGLPTFKAGTMYKNMKLDKKYTLEELRI